MAVFASGLLIWAGHAQARELRDQLDELSTTHGFTVKGLERLGEAPAREVDGALAERLEGLLAGFGHVLVRDASGRIEQVVIAGRNAPTPTGGLRAKLDDRGSQRMVQALLVGHGEQTETALIVDTGATTVVLPMSMIKTLGLSPSELQDGWSQTANGKVKGKHARLRAVRVGDAEVEDVAVMFIPDRKLGGSKLLGMSFLERFNFTFDDERGEIVLHPR